MAFAISYFVSYEECDCGCHYYNLVEDSQKFEHSILKRIFNSVRRYNLCHSNLQQF